MASFTAGLNKVINTNREGIIQYCFKGNQMHPERATVVLQENDVLTVNRNSDDTLFNFIKHDSYWLLKESTNSNSLLYGTQFIFDK